MPHTVFTLGESLIDFVSSTPGTLQQAPSFDKAAGGAPANVAACVARLGGQAAFVGLCGADAFGDFLIGTLADSGVDTQYYQRTKATSTSLAFVSLDAGGDRSFMFYRDPGADTLLQPADVPMAAIAQAGILHIGSVSLAAEPARTATLFAAREARKRGVFVSCDPNWRPSLWRDPAHGLRSIELLYDACDAIKVNREELYLLTGTTDVDTGAMYFHQRGIRLVFITLDADGCYYSHQVAAGDRQARHVPGLPVRVVDTTGAGDAFVGAFLYQLASSTALTWSAEELHTWVRFAIATSALVTTRRGAIPALPTRADVLEVLAGRQ